MVKRLYSEINWVVLENWDIGESLPNVNFIGKEYYSNKTPIFGDDISYITTDTRE